MPKTSSYIKCSKCGIFSTNSDYCENCGELISYEKKIALKETEEKQQRIEKAKWMLAHPNLVERLKQHPFWLYRVAGWVLYSAFLVVSGIGAALAWFFAMVAAG
tara:strand:- start:47682 stop:47993 length:312 start_codon:yes stop_codon:yes gene_type:complete